MKPQQLTAEDVDKGIAYEISTGFAVEICGIVWIVTEAEIHSVKPITAGLVSLTKWHDFA